MPTSWDLDDLIYSLESANHRWPPEGCTRECRLAAAGRSGRSRFCWGRTKNKVHSHGQTPQVQGVPSGRMVFLRSYPLVTAAKEEVKEPVAERRVRVVKCLLGSVVDWVADLSEKAGRAGRSMWKRLSYQAIKRVREVSSSWMKSTSRQLLSCKYRP